MSILLQEIIVGLIILLAVAWIIWKFLLRRKNVSTCNCDGCPFADCVSRKNINIECKKVGKKVAESDK